MQFDAPFGQLHGEGRRVRPLLRATLNRLVGNEPRVPAAASILSLGVAPARNIALVRIRYPEGEPVDRRVAFRREMKNVFVTIVEVARGTDRLEVPTRTR